MAGSSVWEGTRHNCSSMCVYVVCMFSLQAFRKNKENSLYFHYDKPHSFKVGGW